MASSTHKKPHLTWTEAEKTQIQKIKEDFKFKSTFNLGQEIFDRIYADREMTKILKSQNPRIKDQIEFLKNFLLYANSLEEVILGGNSKNIRLISSQHLTEYEIILLSLQGSPPLYEDLKAFSESINNNPILIKLGHEFSIYGFSKKEKWENTPLINRAFQNFEFPLKNEVNKSRPQWEYEIFSSKGLPKEIKKEIALKKAHTQFSDGHNALSNLRKSLKILIKNAKQAQTTLPKDKGGPAKGSDIMTAINTLADIYKNGTGKPAKCWSSNYSETGSGGEFYKFLLAIEPLMAAKSIKLGTIKTMGKNARKLLTSKRKRIPSL